MSKRAKILIVDDERSIRELLEIFLKKEGFEVHSASSAEEGLAQAKPPISTSSCRTSRCRT